MPSLRENRFNAQDTIENSVLSGITDSLQSKAYDKGTVRRNLKEYKVLKQYGRKGGMAGLKGMSDAAIEKKAVRAVLKDNGIKQQKLRTNVNRKQFNLPVLQKAQQKLKAGYDVRQGVGPAKGVNFGKPGLDVADIKNPKLRKATQHLAMVQRNRRIMSTNVWKGKGYDIQQGHIQGPTAQKKYQTGLRKMPTATATRGGSKGGKVQQVRRK